MMTARRRERERERDLLQKLNLFNNESARARGSGLSRYLYTVHIVVCTRARGYIFFRAEEWPSFGSSPIVIARARFRL